jgi:acetyl esterase/lipase
MVFCLDSDASAVTVNAAAALHHVEFSQVLALPTQAPDEVIAYGPAAQQFGELWLPNSTSKTAGPLVVLIHGGCWLNAFDINHSRAMAMALKQQGYAVWSLEYRRIGDVGGGWPGTFEDIAAGVDHVEQLTGRGIDTQRVVLVGHSAGGHLALWASARPQLAPEQAFYQAGSLKPLGVVGLAAIVDLAEYAAGTSSCQRAVRDLMGGTPTTVPGRYRDTSPVELSLLANTLLIQGDDDSIVSPAHAATAATRAGIDRLAVAGAGHFDMIHPDSFAWPLIIKAIDSAFAAIPLAVQSQQDVSK